MRWDAGLQAVGDRNLAGGSMCISDWRSSSCWEAINLEYAQKTCHEGRGCSASRRLESEDPMHHWSEDVRLGNFNFNPADWKNVSEDAKTLIRHLLKMNPKDRYTAEQALNHEWIKNKAPKASHVSLQSNFVDNLRGFRSQNKLKKAALHIIAGQLNEDQIKALRDTFMGLDKNGDGLLTPAELKEGLQKAGLKEIPPDLQAIMEDVDADGSGVIDYTEFLAATLDRRQYIQEDVCWSAFRVFDRNGDGKISQDELKMVLSNDQVEDTLGAGMIVELLKEVDGNGDGVIDFQVQLTKGVPADDARRYEGTGWQRITCLRNRSEKLDSTLAKNHLIEGHDIELNDVTVRIFHGLGRTPSSVTVRGVIVLISAYPHLQLTEPILGPRHLREWPAKISSSWMLGGRKVECKSSRLSWLPSVSTWFVNFRSVKFQEADVRTHAPFDDLYLAVDTSDAVHIAKHDLRTAVQRQGKATAAHGHRVMVRGKRNTTHWRPACEAILQKL
eukprot:s1388_g9.t1